jgi:hypothetical protein
MFLTADVIFGGNTIIYAAIRTTYSQQSTTQHTMTETDSVSEENIMNIKERTSTYV